MMSGDSSLNKAQVTVPVACGKTSVDCCRVRACIKRKKQTQVFRVNVFLSDEEPVSFLMVSVLFAYGRCDAVAPFEAPSMFKVSAASSCHSSG